VRHHCIVPLDESLYHAYKNKSITDRTIQPFDKTPLKHPTQHHSNSRLIRNRRNRLRLEPSQLDRPSFPGRNRLPLEVQLLAIGLCLQLGLRVALHSLQEVLSRAGQLDVLDSHVDALLEVLVSDGLVEDDADGGLCYVVDYAGFAVVVFVWHTLLDGSVADYVDDVSDFVLVEVG